MLNQQESFKPGEVAPVVGSFYCITCDRLGVESVVQLDVAQPYPLCVACQAAGRPDVDQEWVRIEDRARFRRADKVRWK